jgi:hypothetical protein
VFLHYARISIFNIIITGLDDKAKCFHCGGGLHKWKDSDDPWFQHTAWFPNCAFIRYIQRRTVPPTIQESSVRTCTLIWCDNKFGKRKQVFPITHSFMWRYLPYRIIVEKVIFSPTLPGNVYWRRRRRVRVASRRSSLPKQCRSSSSNSRSNNRRNLQHNIHFRNSIWLILHLYFISYFFI